MEEIVEVREGIVHDVSEQLGTPAILVGRPDRVKCPITGEWLKLVDDFLSTEGTFCPSCKVHNPPGVRLRRVEGVYEIFIIYSCPLCNLHTWVLFKEKRGGER